MQKNGSTSVESRIENLKESVRNLVDAGGERAGQLKQRAIGVKDTVVDRGELALDSVRTFIKDHPIASLGIAVGIGYIAVRMLRR